MSWHASIAGSRTSGRYRLNFFTRRRGRAAIPVNSSRRSAKLVQNDHLPDYQVSLEDEMVIFRNRMTWQVPKEQPSYPVLHPETYHDARLVAPSYDVYYLEQEWRDMRVASGMPKVDFPGRAFVGFCKKRYRMKPNP
jgi:hypothetical protein